MRKGVLIAVAVVALLITGCDSTGRVMLEGHEFRNEAKINTWLAAVSDGKAAEVCEGMTDGLRRQALARAGSCENLTEELLELPTSVKVTGSTKLGGTDELGQGVYEYETNEGLVFTVNRDKIDAVEQPGD